MYVRPRNNLLVIESVGGGAWPEAAESVDADAAEAVEAGVAEEFDGAGAEQAEEAEQFWQTGQACWPVRTGKIPT